MNEINGGSFETLEKRIKELEKQNKKLKEQVLNVKDACYCELCYGLEKQNEELLHKLEMHIETSMLHAKNARELKKQIEELIENTIVLLGALCSEDGCQDFKYCDKTRESKCSEVSNTEKLLVEIKQKPIEEILKG